MIPSLVDPDPVGREIDRLIAAERMVRNYCGWHIAPVVTQRLVLDGSGSKSLFVPSLRVLNITACSVGEQELDVDELEWSGDGFLRRSCGWPDRLRSVKLTLEHGFTTAPDVAEIVMEIAARAASSMGGRTRESAGGVSISNALTAPGVSGGVVLMAHEKEALASYRIPGRF